MANYFRDIRILVAGEHGVGKTSLIMSLISEEFQENVPAMAEVITIPSDVTPEKVPTQIVDSSLSEQTEAEFHDEIYRADVICLVYCVPDSDAINKVRNYWLKLFRKVLGDDHLTPVVLVGNQCDLADKSTLEDVISVMDDFQEVETCVECSARTMKNISEMFYYAQKAVLHPTGPLYCTQTRELKPACVSALTRIFDICDLDNDRVLGDRDLDVFQRKCFGTPLQMSALEDVKTVIKRHCGSEGFVKDGLTLKGFLHLHVLFIQRGRHETTWSVLRKFGYQEHLLLSEEYLHPTIPESLLFGVELSKDAEDFIMDLFYRYDVDGDGYLSPAELRRAFSRCPSMPWGLDVLHAIPTGPQGWISRIGFLSQFVLTAFMIPECVLEYLAFLGYPYSFNNLQSALKEPRLSRDRKVFRGCLCGSAGVGKTTFMQGSLGRSLSEVARFDPENIPAYTCSPRKLHGRNFYFILQDIPEVNPSVAVRDYFASADIIALLFDPRVPSSFEYCVSIYEEISHMDHSIPSVFVACKSDLSSSENSNSLPFEKWCTNRYLPSPLHFSAKGKPMDEVYDKLLLSALQPYQSFQESKLHGALTWTKTIGISLVVAGSLIALSVIRRRGLFK